NFTDIKEVSGFPAEGRYLFAETDRFSYLGSSLYYSNDLKTWKENKKAVSMNFNPSVYIVNDNKVLGIGSEGKIGILETSAAFP
ncbi:MAG TPA: hypothetical protein PK683_05515, partial [Leptospiraceae bacterium]|nr:hypothetical protein [Leptospiraceae bacterium]